MSSSKPSLRFSNFSDELNSATLAEITSKKISYGIVQAGPHVEGGMPYIKSKDLNGPLLIEELERTSEEIAKKYHRSEVNPGDIVFSLRGNIGVSQIVPDTIPVANLTQGTARISCSSKINPVYLINELKTSRVRKRVIALAKGSTFREISLEELRNVKVSFPSYKEQEKVANFLSTVDQKISLLKEKHAMLEQYKNGVMQKLFKQEIRFKDDSGSDFPDWKILKLSEISTPIKRRASASVDKIMTISAGKGFLSQEERFSQVIAGTSLEKYTHLKKGEFSYNRGNSKSYTYGCIYKLEEDEALVPYVYRSFSLDDGNTEFFAQLFKFKYLDRQLRRLISSSARMDGLLNIGEKEFYQVKVPFPQEAEQIKIAKFLDSLDMKLDSTAAQIELTQTFKKGLLQQMFV